MPDSQNTTLHFSDRLIRQIFDSLTAHIAIIDETGTILETNRAWKQFSVDNSTKTVFDPAGQNYLHVCDASGKDGDEDARNVAKGIRDVIDKKTTAFLYDYPCHSPTGQRWFYMRAFLMDDQSPVRVIVSHEDITGLKLAQEELSEKNLSLEEANIALKVLIKQRENDKSDMEKKMLSNVKTLVLPYIEKLKSAPLGKRESNLVNILDDHLKDIISPLMQNLSNAGVMMTPQEMQVAALVRDGRRTSEIADILYLSEATVSFHRKNIREKLGLKNRQANLRSYLLSMSQ